MHEGALVRHVRRANSFAENLVRIFYHRCQADRFRFTLQCTPYTQPQQRQLPL